VAWALLGGLLLGRGRRGIPDGGKGRRGIRDGGKGRFGGSRRRGGRVCRGLGGTGRGVSCCVVFGGRGEGTMVFWLRLGGEGCGGLGSVICSKT